MVTKSVTGRFCIESRPFDTPVTSDGGLPLGNYESDGQGVMNSVQLGRKKWARQGSNLRPIGYEPTALPLSYEPLG